jgi:hypothetical protein
MIGHLPDILASIPLRLRLDRERDDARYIIASTHIVSRSAPVASLKRDAAVWPGLDVVVGEQMAPYQPGEKIDFTIGCRVDLDHPIYFADNQFCECADCRCDLQHRPDAPSIGVWLCICCAARRIRWGSRHKQKASR